MTTGVTEYRADELAAAAGISVALLRSYQSKGLLPAPRHQGRVAVYGEHHLERLRHIAELKARGHSLRSIVEQLDPAAPLRAAVPSERLRLRDVAERSGVPVEMLRSWEASGLLRPRGSDIGPVYDESDVRAVRAILLLIGTGIPFEQFLKVAETQLAVTGELASGAVALFDDYVVGRLRGSGEDPAVRAESLQLMAESIGELVSYVVMRRVLEEGAARPAEEAHTRS